MINARGLVNWSCPYEVVDVVNMMNYKVDVKGVVNTYPANMLKQYFEHQNMTSYRSTFADARCIVKSEDHSDPTVHRVKVYTGTSSYVTRGDAMSGQLSPSQVSVSGHDKQLGAEATDPVGSVAPSKGNAKRDVKLKSDVKHAETQESGDFHLVFEHSRSI